MTWFATPWTEVDWPDRNVTAYRIWLRQTPFGVFQRHEWRRRDGSADRDDWIASAGLAIPPHCIAIEPDEPSADAMRQALEQIADGHNDPRALARQTLRLP